MNVRITYPDAPYLQYSERLSVFDVKVLRLKHTSEFLRIFFQEESCKRRAHFGFPVDQALQLGYAINTVAIADDVEPIQFQVMMGEGAIGATLVYESDWSYHVRFSNFDVNVARKGSRIRTSFHQKDGDGKGYFAFSLPIIKANQLGLAICTCASGDRAEPIQFKVNDHASANAVAA